MISGHTPGDEVREGDGGAHQPLEGGRITEGEPKMVVMTEEVSEMHARSELVGILDPLTHQHTAMNHSKSYEALKKIVQLFANNSTTGQEAMQIGRVEAGATAPTTAWPPFVAETSEDSCEL